MRKTPFQRHKAEEERKKKEAEEEAARVYEDFVESFGEGDDEKPKDSGARKGNNKFVPSFMPPGMAAAMKQEPSSKPAEEPVLPAPTSRSGQGKTRNIDKMLETMKRDQELRQERQKQRQQSGSSFGAGMPLDDGLGSFDDGDPFTTNLYVGNLSQGVDEDFLKREFLRFGDIASIKVMWPRDDDQRKRGRNSGFVAFMTRQSAERAKAELNGVVLKDAELKIGWGKAVVLPPIPLYTASGVGGLSTMLAAAKSAVAHVAAPGQIPPPGWGMITGAPMAAPEREADPHQGLGPDITVSVPEDQRLKFIIDSVATYVMGDGCAFEQAIMTKESQNPDYLFLFDVSCLEHAYYRWRLYSFAQGDTLRNWRNDPFVMVENGPRWIPPTMTSLANGSQQTAAQRGGEAKEKDRPLSDSQRDRFEDVLRALTMERSKICDAMVFALDNADSAFEIVEILTDSLTLLETPLTTKVARLMLVSDILHNSTAHVHNASRYRNLLESSLPDVFESLQDTYRRQDSRMKQEVLRRNVLRVLRIWRSWFIFSDDFFNGLQATFLEMKAAAAENAPLRAELEELDEEALALRCRRNGLSREGSREDQIQRFINLQAYLSGDLKPEANSAQAVPAEPAVQPEESRGVFSVNLQPQTSTEIQPEPVKQDVKPDVKKEAVPEVKQKPVEGPVSKWTLVDYDDESAAFPTEGQDDIFQDLDKTPVVDSGKPPDDDSPPERHPSGNEGQEGKSGAQRIDAMEEVKRQKLRQVEVDLLLFREGLEDKGLAKAEVDKEVESQREKLLAKTEARRSTEQRPEPERSRHHDGGSKDKSRGAKRHKTKSPDVRHSERRSSPREKDSRSARSRSRSKEREVKHSRKREASRSRSRERSRSPSPKRKKGSHRSKDDAKSAKHEREVKHERESRHSKDKDDTKHSRDRRRESTPAKESKSSRRQRSPSHERGDKRDRDKAEKSSRKEKDSSGGRRDSSKSRHSRDSRRK